MGRYLVKRLMLMVPVLFVISLVNFALYSFAPGDPVTLMMNPILATSGAGSRMTMEKLDKMIETQREIRGLNRPWYVRYVFWLGELARGNLGRSMVSKKPVSEIIGDFTWPSVQLNLLSIALSAFLGVALGVLQAVRKYSLFDYTAAFFSFFYVSMPGFFLAMLLIYIFALVLGWLPTSGYETVGMPFSFWDRIRHLILPAATLSFGGLPYIMRITRTAMLEVMGEDYIRTARAKGLSEKFVMLKHALRNCLIPVTTLVGGMLMWLFGGSVIVETVFAWPGLGLLFIRVVRERDYPVIMGLVMISSLLSIVVILLTDVVYTMVDPRVRLER